MIGWAGVIAAMSLLAANAPPYVWPLDLPRALTSSFAEYRPGRFHAGIDLHTGDVPQLVHAASDGYISRVSCSPWGYGKAIYLTLADGNTVVYGHLSDFYPALRAYVQKAQHEQQRYTVNLMVSPQDFPVHRGDIIAWSGQTGIGSPHLHYEIRNVRGDPINPRLLGITWPDSTPPVIRKVLVVPQTPADRINGDIEPLILEAHQSPDGAYRTAPIRVRGTVGFGVDVIDPANGNENRLGIHVLRTTANSQEIFRIRHDRVSYSTIHNGAVAYHPFYLRQGTFLLQWRWPGNSCAIYQDTDADGWFTTPDRPTEVRIEAVDFAENAATVTIPVEPEAGDAAVPVPTSGTGTGTVAVECVGEWLVITAQFTAPESETPQLTLDGSSTPAEEGFHRLSDTVFRAGYQPSTSTENVTIKVNHPRVPEYTQHVDIAQRGGSDRILNEDGLTIAVKPNSPYGALFLTTTQPAGLPQAPGLTPLAPAYRLWPEAARMDVPIEIAFPVPAQATQAGRAHLYRQTATGWRFEETARTGELLTLHTQQLGVFAIMEDAQAPTVSHFGAAPKKWIVSAARPRISATVLDAGSGVAEVTATCDGRWWLMEYDPERNLAVWARDEDLPPGKHTIVLRATDRAGNTAEETRRIERRKPISRPPKKGA